MSEEDDNPQAEPGTAKRGSRKFKNVSLATDNADFVDLLVAQYETTPSNVLNRLIEAARYGVPYAITKKRSAHLRKSYSYIEEKKILAEKAKALRAGMKYEFYRDFRPVKK